MSNKRPPKEPVKGSLRQVDYPETASYKQDVGIEKIISGLNWYALFQINEMNKRKKRDGHNKVFIDKLNSEIKQTQVCIYQEFSK